MHAPALALGALFSATAAIAHLACIAIGAPAYRVMGAGERMARAAQAGRLQPALVTLAVAAMLSAWAGYAVSGAGVVGPWPFTRPALVLITVLYLARGLAFALLKPLFPGNSATFWWISSGLCLLIGLVHLYGLLAAP
ncbi:hypothetical protein [Pulveribacter suum]|uniref:MAPEG family protein n=1 Tax=Pulveribacter suum TaxID=2116657 RepID=A0A2P1NHN3_9BURK|nr:hypothetical protein [Pulveribacter suum]AVP56558.1 hypothetical protein C7H73_01940 [Pulveribacter suum]